MSPRRTNSLGYASQLAERKKEAEQLKTKGWVTTGDLPFTMERESGFKIRASAVSKFGLMRIVDEAIAQDVLTDPTYRAQHVRRIGKSTFMSPEVTEKVKTLIRAKLQS